MQFAVDPESRRVLPSKGAKGVCPICAEPVIAKCGQIKVHHWAHLARLDCDPWFEPETEWHRAWKSLFPSESVEVPIGEHRADIRHNGLVIELQNSKISPAVISERERHYGRMIWVVNAAPFAKRFFVMRQMSEGVFSFKWKSLKSSWREAKRPVYFDFGALSVQDLLGAKLLDPTVYRPSKDEIRSYDRVSAGRLDAEGEKVFDASLENLAADVRSRTILRKISLHANGYGSAEALARTDLLKICGLG